MAVLRISTPLRPYINGKSEVELQGETVLEVVEDLILQYPALRPHLFSSEGKLRAFVNLFLNDQDVRNLQGMETPVKENDRLVLVPSIAGGSRRDGCFPN